jgi:hypothetical protein
MDVRITVETTFDNGEKRTHQLYGISRPYRVTCPDGIGLRLEDGKRIVDQIRRALKFALNNTHTIEFALERCGFARHGLQGFV